MFFFRADSGASYTVSISGVALGVASHSPRRTMYIRYGVGSCPGARRGFGKPSPAHRRCNSAFALGKAVFGSEVWCWGGRGAWSLASLAGAMCIKFGIEESSRPWPVPFDKAPLGRSGLTCLEWQASHGTRRASEYWLAEAHEVWLLGSRRPLEGYTALYVVAGLRAPELSPSGFGACSMHLFPRLNQFR